MVVTVVTLVLLSVGIEVVDDAEFRIEFEIMLVTASDMVQFVLELKKSQ